MMQTKDQKSIKELVIPSTPFFLIFFKQNFIHLLLLCAYIIQAELLQLSDGIITNNIIDNTFITL